MHGIPGSQQRSVLQEKENLARVLLGRGLTISQVAQQLRCSRQFVRRISKEELEKISPGRRADASDAARLAG